MSRPKNWDAHRRRELTRKSREARAINDRLDARTDQWLEQHWQLASDLAAEMGTTLEDAVVTLRRTMGEMKQR